MWSGVVQNRGFGYFGRAGSQTVRHCACRKSSKTRVVRHCAALTVSARCMESNKLYGKSPVSSETGDFCAVGNGYDRSAVQVGTITVLSAQRNHVTTTSVIARPIGPWQSPGGWFRSRRITGRLPRRLSAPRNDVVIFGWSFRLYGRSLHRTQRPPAQCAGGFVQWSRKYFTRSIKPGFFQVPHSSLGMSMTYFSQTLMTFVP